MTDAAELVLTPDGFNDAYRNLLRSEEKSWPSRSWGPSRLGHPCDRYLVWCWTRWQEKAPFDPVKLAIFREGNIHQPDVYTRLEAMGFKIQRENEKAVQWTPRPGVLISGKIDGKALAYKGVRYDPSIIVEIKTTQGHTFDALNTVEDVRRHHAFYVRGYYDQMQLYLLLEERPRGLLVWKNKQTGMLKVLPPVEIDFQRGEELIQKAERLTPMVRAKVDPPPISWDPMVCGGCEFEHLCYPPKDAGQGAVLIDDEKLAEDLEQIAALASAAAEHDDLLKSAKARLKRMIGCPGTGMVGRWQIDVKEVSKREYMVPARVEQHVKISPMA